MDKFAAGLSLAASEDSLTGFMAYLLAQTFVVTLAGFWLGKKAGVKVEYRRYEKAGHGFGTGAGTDAEGWMDHALDFWERNMTQ